MRRKLAILVLVVLSTPFVFNLSALAQTPVYDLSVSDVVLTEVDETPDLVIYEALATVKNRGSSDFDGIQRIEYNLDTGETGLVYVLTQLSAGDELRFTFRLGLMPGDRIVSVIAGQSRHESQVRVGSADISIEVTGKRVVEVGIVEFDLRVSNVGNRIARDVDLIGDWQRIDDGLIGTADFGRISDAIDIGDETTANVSFNVAAGSYTFRFVASTTSVEQDKSDNVLEVDYDVEFVELDIGGVSAEVIRWRADGSGLVAISFTVSNVGIADSDAVLIGVKCAEDACSESTKSRAILAGEMVSMVLETWIEVGSADALVYAGAIDDGYRWGFRNVSEIAIEVPEPPLLEWSLEAVSDVEGFGFWRDGSANVVFETRMVNDGSDLVSGVVMMSVECLNAGKRVDGCGGEIPIAVDPQIELNLAQHTFKVPAGKTELHFSIAETHPIAKTVIVPKRILGVDREIWECFKDTSYVGREGRSHSGIGCAGWRNPHITKWPIGQPIKIWKFGDDDHVAKFNRALDYIAPLLNVEFAEVKAKTQADIFAYLGTPRTEELDELKCNYAAGCTTFEIGSDGEFKSARLVVWPPLSVFDERGYDRMFYSVALHELVHALTGMLHRDNDRTSLMSYDSLDYTTLGEVDEALLRIWADPLVYPGMEFHEIANLIVFEDELLDPQESTPGTSPTQTLLRNAHAKLMDEGTVTYEVSGGWTRCGFVFEDAEYTIGGLRPRTARWIHFKDADASADVYLVKSQNDTSLFEIWTFTNGEWIKSDSALQQLNFRDSFSNPLTMLSSINLYADDAEIIVVDENEDFATLAVELSGADVRTLWSSNTTISIQLQVNPQDFKIPSYEIKWEFEPDRQGVCDNYQIKARNGQYGATFEFSDDVREESEALAADGYR